MCDTDHYLIFISQAEQIIILNTLNTYRQKRKAKSVYFKTPWMSGSQLAVYYQHSDQVSQSSLQMSTRAGGAQDWHGTAISSSQERWRVKKHHCFLKTVPCQRETEKNLGTLGSLQLQRILFPAFVFSSNMNHTIQLGYQNRILKGWTPPTRNMAVIALPFSIPVTDPLQHHHLICWSRDTEHSSGNALSYI